MTFGKGFPISIKLDPAKKEELEALKTEVDLVFARLTQGVISVKSAISQCLAVKDPEFRDFIRSVFSAPLRQVTEEGVDNYLTSRDDVIRKILFTCYLEYQTQVLTSPEVKMAFYRQKMIKALLESGRITMKGMRQELQRLLNPDYQYAHQNQPDVDNDMYLQIFDELRTQFGTPTE